MDWQFPIPHKDDDLTLQVDKIISYQPPSLPKALLSVLKQLLKQGQNPSCYSCAALIFDTLCFLINGQLYCIKCKQEFNQFFSSNENSECTQYQMVDLNQSIFKGSSWSIRDHLELTALAEKYQQIGKTDEKIDLLKLGTKMQNKKASKQILQHLKDLSVRSLKQQSCMNEEYSSPCLKSQNISFTVRSFTELEQLEQHESREDFFQKFRACEGQLLKTVSQTVLATSRNKKKLQAMQVLMLAQLQQNFAIYSQLLKISELLNKKKSQQFLKKAELIDQATNTHENIKDESYIDCEASETIEIKNAKEKEIFAEFQKLIQSQSISAQYNEKEQGYAPNKRRIKKPQHLDYLYSSSSKKSRKNRVQQ